MRSHTSGAYPSLTVPRESNDHVSCVLGNVVTLEREGDIIDFVVWDPRSICSGLKGIFPEWCRAPSVCSSPLDCVLLKSGALLYPPDKGVWFPMIDRPDWEQTLKPMFSSLPLDAKFDSIREHVMAQKQRWGLA